MTKKIAGIYVPGLGDHRSLGQDNAVKDWGKYGVLLEYHPVGWAEKDGFKKKLSTITNQIDDLYSKYGKVVLIGASAGASAVLNAAAERPDKVRYVVSICGKINNPDFNHLAFKKNPDFIESMKLLPKSLENLKAKKIPILSVNSIYDGTVPKADTIIEGAKSITLPMIGHVPTIAFAVSLGKKKIIKFIKNV